MNNLIVVSPKCTSDSAEDLAKELDIFYVNKENLDPSYNGNIINWGCSNIEGVSAEQIILNNPRAVRRSLNKLRTFELLSDKVRMPTMTLNKEEAVQWAKDGRIVVVRNRIKGCKGQGITKSKNPQEIETLPAKFYTRFIANCTEYRVNVFKGEVLTVYRKEPCGNDFRFKIQLDSGPLHTTHFQSMFQGFIDNVHEHIKLDMFGLDILISPKGKAFLLEVNSAPILFPITLKRLAKAIKKEIENV